MRAQWIHSLCVVSSSHCDSMCVSAFFLIVILQFLSIFLLLLPPATTFLLHVCVCTRSCAESKCDTLESTHSWNGKQREKTHSNKHTHLVFSLKNFTLYPLSHHLTSTNNFFRSPRFYFVVYTLSFVTVCLFRLHHHLLLVLLLLLSFIIPFAICFLSFVNAVATKYS